MGMGILQLFWEIFVEFIVTFPKRIATLSYAAKNRSKLFTRLHHDRICTREVKHVHSRRRSAHCDQTFNSNLS